MWGLAFYGWIFYRSKFYEVTNTFAILAKAKEELQLANLPSHWRYVVYVGRRVTCLCPSGSETRVDLLRQILESANKPDAKAVLWRYVALAGASEPSIARTPAYPLARGH